MLLARRFVLLSVAVAAGLFSAGAAPQDFPSKPIRIIAPNTPGNITDLIARIVAPEMTKSLGQPFIVEYKPGAGGVIGYEYVAKQVPADGYTILMGCVPCLAILPATVKDLRFDPLTDIPAVIGLANTRIFFATPSTMPWKNINEMVAYVKANPGKLNFGSSAVITRLYTEAVLKQFNLSVLHVPYPATGPFVQALSTGEVHMGFVGDTTVVGMGDKLRILAVSGEQRQAPYLDIPIFSELNLPLQSVWYTFNVRAGTPRPVLDRLYASASAALRQPDVKAQIAKLRLDVLEGGTPELAANRLAEQGKLYSEIARGIGIRAE